MPLSNEEQQALNSFLAALQRLRRAYEKFSRATPTREESQRSYEQAFADVLSRLDDPALAKVVNSLLGEVGTEKTTQELDEAQIQIEVRLSSLFGFKNQEARQKIMTLSRRESHPTLRVRSIDELREQLVSLHKASLDELAKSREEARKQKKRRKSKVRQGIASGLFGAGIMIADTHMPLLFQSSYALGLVALHQALRDLAGQAGDEEGGGD